MLRGSTLLVLIIMILLLAIGSLCKYDWSSFYECVIEGRITTPYEMLSGLKYKQPKILLDTYALSKFVALSDQKRLQQSRIWIGTEYNKTLSGVILATLHFDISDVSKLQANRKAWFVAMQECYCYQIQPSCLFLFNYY